MSTCITSALNTVLKILAASTMKKKFKGTKDIHELKREEKIPLIVGDSKF